MKNPAVPYKFKLSNPLGKSFEKLPHDLPVTHATESPTEKALRLSQDSVHKLQVAFHDADPNNPSAVRIARRKMDDAELHHHALWIKHDKEVKAQDAKLEK